MITLSAVIAAYEAIDRLINPQPVENVGWLFAAGLVGVIGNELVARYRIRVGGRIGSAALTTDGYRVTVSDRPQLQRRGDLARGPTSAGPSLPNTIRSVDPPERPCQAGACVTVVALVG
jgi:hypothetical protein